MAREESAEAKIAGSISVLFRFPKRAEDTEMGETGADGNRS